jgi:pyridoxal phosphate enzyme (YggS family)
VTLAAADVRAGYAAARAACDAAARRAGRDPGDVEILAAVKYVERDDLPALAAAGIRRVGENRSEALLAKQPGFEETFTWDFIGHLQSRKVRDVVGRVALVHALQSPSAARQIAERASAPQDVLVEVNVAADPAKYGVLPDALDAFLELLAGLPTVRVRGLMTMPPFVTDPAASRGAFAALRELAARCASRWAPDLAFDVLSMGTSQDYVVAVEEGATIVRLGSVLYGRDRPPPPGSVH